jgi:radical SAM protein with 4Fe4S-binding SPASM domain
MEFIDLSRCIPVNKPYLSPFSVLKTLQPVVLLQDMTIDKNANNIAYAKSLAQKGMTVVPIKRKPPTARYINRIQFPRRVIFEMTSRCNFLCRMCPQQNLRRPRMDMPGNLYRKIIDEIDSYGIEGLWTYHLGESLIHPEFQENIKHISTKKNLGVIWMSTNGQYFNEANIRCILQSNIDYINYSMHAVTEKTYKTVASQGDFSTVKNNLETFFKLKGTDSAFTPPFLHCQMIEQETTKHEVDFFIEKYYKLADIVSVNMLEYVNLPNNNFGLEQRVRKPLSSCLRISRNDCFILSNGMVTLCDAAYNGELTLGNINTAELYEIWNGSIRKKMLELNGEGKLTEVPICNSCKDYDI